MLSCGLAHGAAWVLPGCNSVLRMFKILDKPPSCGCGAGWMLGVWFGSYSVCVWRKRK